MRIRRDHDFGLDEAKRRVDGVAADISQKFSLRSNWQGNTLMFRGTGVNGQVDVAADSVEFHVKLGLALMLMEQPLRNAIETALDKELGEN